MYLTSLPNIVGDDYRSHQILAALFAPQRILYLRKGPQVAVLSPSPLPLHPQKSHDVTDIIAAIENDSMYHFSTRLNPSISKRRDSSSNNEREHAVVQTTNSWSKREAIPPQETSDWVKHQFDKNGATVHCRTTWEGIRRSKKKSYEIALASVHVQGIVIVKDAEAFRNIVVNGLGHGKGLGFGMIDIFSSYPATEEL